MLAPSNNSVKRVTDKKHEQLTDIDQTGQTAENNVGLFEEISVPRNSPKILGIREGRVVYRETRKRRLIMLLG